MSGRLFHSKYKAGIWERAVTPCGAAPAACPSCRDARSLSWNNQYLTECEFFLFVGFFCWFGVFFSYSVVYFFPQHNRRKTAFTLHSHVLVTHFWFTLYSLEKTNFFLLFLKTMIKRKVTCFYASCLYGIICDRINLWLLMSSLLSLWLGLQSRAGLRTDQLQYLMLQIFSWTYLENLGNCFSNSFLKKQTNKQVPFFKRTSIGGNQQIFKMLQHTLFCWAF